MATQAKAKGKRSKAAAATVDGLLIEEVSFKREHRVFKRGRKIKLRPGVNLLVGEQGSGKSSLLTLLTECVDRLKSTREQAQKVISLKVVRDGRVLSFDFENQNPRTLGYFMNDASIGFQVQSKFQSHGETVKAILRGLAAKDRDPTLILLDEPDMALSPRSAHWLARHLQLAADQGHQIIAAVHNPIVIASQPQVLSLEHKRWMSPEKFLADHQRPLDGDE